MSVGQWILRVAAVTVILGGAILLTPTFTIAPPCGTQTTLTCVGDSYEIPDLIWLPIVALVNLNDFLPFSTLLLLLVTDLTIKAAMAAWALASWVWGKVAP